MPSNVLAAICSIIDGPVCVSLLELDVDNVAVQDDCFGSAGRDVSEADGGWVCPSIDVVNCDNAALERQVRMLVHSVGLLFA